MGVSRLQRALLTAAVLLTLGTFGAAPAAATDFVEPEPSQAELAAQAKANQLQQQAEAEGAQVGTARSQLETLSMQAGAALESYTEALRSLQAAQAEEERTQDALQVAQAQLEQSRTKLGQWAREAYQGGPLGSAETLGSSLALVTVLRGGSTDDIGTTLTWLRRVGESRNATLNATRVAEQARSSAADAAADASETATRDAVAATTARNAAQAAVARARVELDRSEHELAQTRKAATAAAIRARQLTATRLLGMSPNGARIGPNRVTGPVGSCAGGDVASYPNGRIPIAALCPIAAAPGQYLRADAAHAFDQLSLAYAEHFGRPPCVTDSYRDYDTQVRLYATKPNLAAIPGTSNHGWGTATDLCGGIDNFGTPEHNWMLLNAPQYGWFHPGWAEPNGPRPEPWHWEYAG